MFFSHMIGEVSHQTSIKNIWDHWFDKLPGVSFSWPHPFDFLCTQLYFLLLLIGFCFSLNGVDSGFWRLVLAHHYSDFLHSAPSSKSLVSFFIKPPWDRSLLPQPEHNLTCRKVRSEGNKKEQACIRDQSPFLLFMKQYGFPMCLTSIWSVEKQHIE